ncbi:MAG: LemA family protein [Candidatus Omnitrophica bacterium]|nr:LemA family protein [Candidatus Omnitrophota bacterium]
MSLVFLILLGFVVIGVIGLFVSIYNGLIIVSKNIDKAWANINVLLKQRHDEIPKLIKTCEAYMQYEKGTLEKLTAARTACINAKGVGASAKAEGELNGVLKSLFAVAENYPDLKANQNFIQFQNRVSYLESQIADRREFFNDSVNQYNIRIQQLPDVFVANMLNMKEKELFNISEEDRKDVDVDFKLP